MKNLTKAYSSDVKDHFILYNKIENRNLIIKINKKDEYIPISLASF